MKLKKVDIVLNFEIKIMKRLIATAGLLMCFGVVFAGGLLTNGNQSAQYIRMLSRNASTTYDAVYFNPAGLMKMENGLFVSIQSQTLDQTRTITSGYPYLNSPIYEGEVKVPVFPTAFAIYKMDKVAFSLGFGPNSGGGSAEYNTGLPSFEKTISSLVPGLAGLTKLGQSVTNYKTDISFKGESVYWGIQGGVSYKINDKLSVYGGLRYVPATNTYTGYIKNIQLKVNGTFKNAATYLTNEIAPTMTGMANQSTAAANSVQPLITGGAGGLTLAQANGAGLITSAQRAQLEGGLLTLGATQAQINVMPITTVQATYKDGAATLNGQAAQMTATGAQLNDKSVDVKQTGAGFTPILGANISPVEGLNIGIKYEFKTKLELTNATKVDGTGMFPDGAKTNSDIPALFSIGADYKVTKKLNLSVSYNNYNDKGVDWGKNIYGETRTIDSNSWELAFGGQYQIIKWLAVSAGYLHTDMGVSQQFNSDFSYYANSNTFGGGFEITPMANLTVDLGALVTKYQTASKSFKDANPAVGNYVELYDKHNVGFAIGLGYHFGGK
jgi:long-chain fatty acid transport protein